MVARSQVQPRTQVPFLSPLEVAQIHGVSVRTVRRWISEGRLDAYRLGKRRIGIKPADSEKLAQPIPTERSA